MTTADVKETDSGFNCPAIGDKVPRGYEFVKTQDGRWKLRRKDHGADHERTDN